MRRLLLTVATLAVVLGPASPAWAHTELVSASPAKGATLPRAPAEVRLEFSQRLNPDFTTIVVSDAAKRPVDAADPLTDRAAGRLRFTRPLVNGAYTVAYRVVSADGHTLQGSYPFTVADPSRPAAVVAVSSDTAVAAPAAGSTSRTIAVPAAVPIALALAVTLLAALATFRYASRRRRG